MIDIILTSNFITKMVPFLKLAVKNEISVKPEEPELPLPKSYSEHLGYFSADVFAWLVFFFPLNFFLIAIFTVYVNSNFYCVYFIKKHLWRTY